MGCSTSKQQVAEAIAAPKAVGLSEPDDRPQEVAGPVLTLLADVAQRRGREGIKAAEFEDAAAAAEDRGAASGSGSPVPQRRPLKSRTVPPCLFREQSCNGFKTVPEGEVVACRAESVAAFTLPAEALTHEPSRETVISHFSNGDQERKIHCNTPLQEVELAKLAMLRVEAKAEGLSFFPCVTSMATRFLSCARMDPKKALKMMQATQEWRRQYFREGPLTDAHVREDMRHGIVYFSGRDHALRPAIMIRAARIPQQWYKEKRVDKLIRLLVFCMEYFLRWMVVPGRVENLSVVVDMRSIGVAQVPLAALREIYRVMSHHYVGRVFRFYVCNVSPTLNMIAGMAKSLLTDRQKQKVVVLDDVSELRKDFALHQLEEDLGGSRSRATHFFPFPLESGPFEAGYAAGPNESSVPNVHEVLTAGGAIGHLWDPRSSEEENTRIDYRPKVTEILRRCNLPAPPELLFEWEPATTMAGCPGKAPTVASDDEDLTWRKSRSTSGGSYGAPTDSYASSDTEEVLGDDKSVDALGTGGAQAAAAEGCHPILVTCSLWG